MDDIKDNNIENNNKNRNNGRSNRIILTILILVIGISIGYAALSATLSITGNTNISRSRWDVHFENLNVTPGSVTATVPAVIDGQKVNINYAISLDKPGDFYEFDVDVKNGGNLPAKIAVTPVVAGLSDAQKVYTSYTVTYSNGETVKENDVIGPGNSRKIVVKVMYKDDIAPEQLPTTDQSVELTFLMSFIQG